jgi:hypothetical protein
MNSASKFLIHRSFDLFDCLTVFKKLGGPQGLLLTERSAGPVVLRETTEKAFMVGRRFVAPAITKDLVEDFRIFSCRSISLTCSPYEQ